MFKCNSRNTNNCNINAIIIGSTNVRCVTGKISDTSNDINIVLDILQYIIRLKALAYSRQFAHRVIAVKAGVWYTSLSLCVFISRVSARFPTIGRFVIGIYLPPNYYTYNNNEKKKFKKKKWRHRHIIRS